MRCKTKNQQLFTFFALQSDVDPLLYTFFLFIIYILILLLTSNYFSSWSSIWGGNCALVVVSCYRHFKRLKTTHLFVDLKPNICNAH